MRKNMVRRLLKHYGWTAKQIRDFFLRVHVEAQTTVRKYDDVLSEKFTKVNAGEIKADDES